MRPAARDHELAAGDEGAYAGGGAEAEHGRDGFGGEEGGGIGVVHCGGSSWGGGSGGGVGWGNLLRM